MPISELMTMLSLKRLALVFAWLVTLVVAMAAGAYGYKHRARIRSLVSSLQNDPVIATNLYTLKVQKLAIPADGRDGGIAQLGDGILFVDRTGSSSWIGPDRSVRPLAVRVPVNVEEFEADPFNADTQYRELFGVKDIALQTIPGGVRLLASHSHWNTAEECNTLRVSSLEATEQQLMSGVSASEWRLLFETQPCRPLEETSDGSHRIGLGAGGRVAPLPDGSVLLTVGGFDPENEMVLQAPQSPDNSYGKSIRIDPVSGESGIYTIGHRNPQGLAVASDGRVWLSEHAARGGDELNLLVEGKNYGYPLVAYGTQYDAMEWPLSAQQGRHEGYDKPMFVWVPSIGISQLIVLENDGFPHWRGDLIVSSLAGQSLYRVRVEEGRAIFSEPIPVGHRIRDIVEAADGSIVLKTDDNFLIYLTALSAATASTPAERGALLAAQCQSCHATTSAGGNGIGPSLWNVVDRPIASAEGFQYSPALRAVDGRWTHAALRSFLADPSSFAPGTTMQLATSFDAGQIENIIAYLETLK